ncbi:hypothetical protein Cgig2_007798 [Carnegiea gigantea]|uniref:Uncharacterized protein n=1 Tax=Carnegiea gigantea TaxID=171969 RepID=A0A9Q1GKN2_9CARY|nr:hypothetical protein Cgig2_007798 [Carnegiea gigantea]
MTYATYSRRNARFEEQEQTSKLRGEPSVRRRTLECHSARECTCNPPREAHAARVAVTTRPQPMTMAPKLHNVWKCCEFHERNGHTTTECKELRKALHELDDKGQIDRFLKRGIQFLRKEPIGGTVGSYGRTREACYVSHNGIRWTRGPALYSPHNDPLVVELKVANAIVR